MADLPPAVVLCRTRFRFPCPTRAGNIRRARRLRYLEMVRISDSVFRDKHARRIFVSAHA